MFVRGSEPLLPLHSQKKGTKAVIGVVPFQKVHFCPFQVLICTI